MCNLYMVNKMCSYRFIVRISSGFFCFVTARHWLFDAEVGRRTAFSMAGDLC
jgi:hypothetical protein